METNQCLQCRESLGKTGQNSEYPFNYCSLISYPQLENNLRKNTHVRKWFWCTIKDKEDDQVQISQIRSFWKRFRWIGGVCLFISDVEIG